MPRLAHPPSISAVHVHAPRGLSYVAFAALGVTCGTLGYVGCSVFVRRIYRNIKSD